VETTLKTMKRVKNRFRLFSIILVKLFLVAIESFLEFLNRRGGMGPKNLGGSWFYKGHRDIAEKPHITLKKPLFH
jgi:hypothetical protein